MLTSSALIGRMPGRSLPVKIVVNFDVCESNAVCMGIVPEVFEVRDDGFLYVLDEHPPESMRARLQEAVNGCPTGAISIAEDE
jgi:ferredoxin